MPPLTAPSGVPAGASLVNVSLMELSVGLFSKDGDMFRHPTWVRYFLWLFLLPLASAGPDGGGYGRLRRACWPGKWPGQTPSAPPGYAPIATERRHASRNNRNSRKAAFPGDRSRQALPPGLAAWTPPPPGSASPPARTASVPGRDRGDRYWSNRFHRRWRRGNGWRQWRPAPDRDRDGCDAGPYPPAP